MRPISVVLAMVVALLLAFLALAAHAEEPPLTMLATAGSATIDAPANLPAGNGG